MTQAARPETVLGDFDDVILTNRGHRVRLEREDETFWATLIDPALLADPDPERPSTAPTVRARVVMSTGSHHFQTYWLRRPSEGELYRGAPDNGALVQLPFVWLIEERRWIPNQDSFLHPPSESIQRVNVWNAACAQCHSVSTEPGLHEGDFETRSVELGIACESCHGPAAEHAARFRSPLARYTARLSDGGIGGDAKIVHPGRLSRDRSVEACAQCHSFSDIVDKQGFQTGGLDYRPGGPLEERRRFLRYEDPPESPHLLERIKASPALLDWAYWSDGTIRVAGREANGLIESACFVRGTLTCVHCHSMHDYREPSDQLVKGDMNGVCLDCHADLAADVSAHTRHAAESSGSECVNCHMPRTTYGLFTAMNSHRIDSPSAEVSERSGRPNACNLCHLDRSLEWTDARLVQDFAAPGATVPLSSVPTGALWALSGDAAQRAVTAWHFGWEPARRAMQRDMAPVASALLNDPYSAVRRVASEALRRASPEIVPSDYDFLAPEAERRAHQRTAYLSAPMPLTEALFRELAGKRKRPPGGNQRMSQDNSTDELAARHLRFGWGALFVFMLLGVGLEAMHAFKLDLYLAPRNDTRRLLFTLAHAHGTLLAIIHLLFSFTLRGAAPWPDGQLALASRCLSAGTVLLPGGFFLGGLWIYEGDPGLGALLGPLGAGLLLVATGLAFRNGRGSAAP